MPKLKKLYAELKEKNIDIEFIGIGTNLENEKWINFVKENELPWLNISDFPDANKNPKKYLYDRRVTDLASLNFRKTYDIFSTPQIYLLDENKKIVGKKLDALTLGDLIQRVEKIDLPYVEVLKAAKKEKEKENAE
jgi:hypothetical protein